ncbi:MAG: YraN family protein [Pseudomonadota bacterium]
MSRKRGNQAEDRALQYLQQQGLKLTARNYHSRRGELDLVMTDRNCLVFVEVRERNNLDYGSAAESISETKVRKLVLAAERFRQQHQHLANLPCRFDIVCIEDNELQWTPHAFTAD